MVGFLLGITQGDYNSVAIITMLFIILYFVSNIKQRFKRIGKNSLSYLTTRVKIKSTEYAPSGIITIDSEGTVIAWNQGATNIFGFSEKEMIGNSLMQVMPERNWEKHVQALKNPTGKSNMVGRTMDLTALSKEKKEFPIRLTLWKWQEGVTTFYTGIVRDITEEKINEMKLTQLLEMYSNAEEIDDSGVWSWDVLNDIVYTSKGYNKIYEIEPPEKINVSYILNRIYYEDLAMVEAKVKDVFEEKKEYTLTHRIMTRDGRLINVETHGEPKLNAKGELISITGVTHII